MLLQPSMANPLICGNGSSVGTGPVQSPDIIGISNTYMAVVAVAAASSVATSTTTMTPNALGLPQIHPPTSTSTSTTVTAAPGNIVGSEQHQTSNVSSSAIGTTAQYTTAPTFRGPEYIMDHDGTLHRPKPPPTATTSASTTLKTTMVAMSPPIPASAHRPQQQQQPQHCTDFPYDGTAPRTLSTGVPVNSQFYYG